MKNIIKSAAIIGLITSGTTSTNNYVEDFSAVAGFTAACLAAGVIGTGMGTLISSAASDKDIYIKKENVENEQGKKSYLTSFSNNLAHALPVTTAIIGFTTLQNTIFFEKLPDPNYNHLASKMLHIIGLGLFIGVVTPLVKYGIKKPQIEQEKYNKQYNSPEAIQERKEQDEKYKQNSKEREEKNKKQKAIEHRRELEKLALELKIKQEDTRLNQKLQIQVTQQEQA